MAVVSFTPDLGYADLDDLFVAAENPLLIESNTNDWTSTVEAEGSTTYKGLTTFRMTIAGTIYTVPFTVRASLKVKNGGLIYWRSSNGQSGKFRFYRDPLKVG